VRVIVYGPCKDNLALDGILMDQEGSNPVAAADEEMIRSSGAILEQVLGGEVSDEVPQVSGQRPEVVGVGHVELEAQLRSAARSCMAGRKGAPCWRRRRRTGCSH
jgi:hypothetical protein